MFFQSVFKILKFCQQRAGGATCLKYLNFEILAGCFRRQERKTIYFKSILLNLTELWKKNAFSLFQQIDHDVK